MKLINIQNKLAAILKENKVKKDSKIAELMEFAFIQGAGAVAKKLPPEIEEAFTLSVNYGISIIDKEN